MATYVLIHGAGDVGWYWHLVAAELRERGHDTVARTSPATTTRPGCRSMRTRSSTRSATEPIWSSSRSRPALSPRRSSASEWRWSCSSSSPVSSLAGRSSGRLVGNTGYEPEPGEWSGDEVATLYHDVPEALTAEALDADVTSRTRRAASPGRFAPGPRCRHDSCCAVATACFRPPSFAESSKSASGLLRLNRRRTLRRLEPTEAARAASGRLPKEVPQLS